MHSCLDRNRKQWSSNKLFTESDGAYFRVSNYFPNQHTLPNGRLLFHTERSEVSSDLQDLKTRLETSKNHWYTWTYLKNKGLWEVIIFFCKPISLSNMRWKLPVDKTFSLHWLGNYCNFYSFCCRYKIYLWICTLLILQCFQIFRAYWSWFTIVFGQNENIIAKWGYNVLPIPSVVGINVTWLYFIFNSPFATWWY